MLSGYSTRVTRQGVTNGVGAVNPSGAHGFTPVLSGVRVARSLIFCVVFWGPLYCLPFMLFVCCCVVFVHKDTIFIQNLRKTD